MNNGLLFIISAPSGGGKDAVIAKLIKIFPRSSRLVTTTSRTPRPGELEGVNYYYISTEEFKKKIANDEFVEYNFFAGNFYGVEKVILNKFLSNNDIIFATTEVNGKHNFDKLKIANLGIFLLPESLEILQNRIEKRGGTTEKSLKERLDIAKNEILESKDYPYHLVNKDGAMQETVEKIEEIVRNELSKRANA
ncbi:MAG: guanylate kinase [Patescibacteria group bacterium]